MSRRTWAERKHLEESLPAILNGDPHLQVWFVTSAAEDNPDVALTANAVVRGVKSMLRHHRLKERVVGSFNVLEVAHKTSRIDPCSHVHSILVTHPIDKGRSRISEAEWVRIWEECCPLARKRDPTVKLIRQNINRPKPNLSIVAKQVPRTEIDLQRIINYCCKWSYPERIARNYRDLLLDPETFFNRIDALKRVTRFFGNLHRNPRNASPLPC